MEYNQTKLYNFCISDKKNYASLIKSNRLEDSILNKIVNNEDLAFDDINKVCVLLKGNITDFINKKEVKDKGQFKVIELLR